MTSAVVHMTRFLRKTIASAPRTTVATSSNRGLATDKKDPDHVTKRYFPRRCLLYVPGSDEAKLHKSQTLKPDSFVFDCEDGVAGPSKQTARDNIMKILQEVKPLQKKTEYGVRINSIPSGLAEEDLRAVLSGERIPHTIYLPKVESPEDIDWFAQTAGKHMQKKDKDINLVIYAESAQSLINLKDICSEAKKLEEYSIFNFDAIVFGSDDYCASIGATRSAAGQEVLVARQQVVMTAKAFGIEAIDVVFIDFNDLEGLKKQAEEGSSMGFTGKQCIHPNQIDIITRAFTPTQERIDWARQVITLYRQHEKEGKGAFVFKGSMIDKPLLLQAENIVRLADLI
jgi:citrate lyase subunit beta-like protein